MLILSKKGNVAINILKGQGAGIISIGCVYSTKVQKITYIANQCFCCSLYGNYLEYLGGQNYNCFTVNECW